MTPPGTAPLISRQRAADKSRLCPIRPLAAHAHDPHLLHQLEATAARSDGLGQDPLLYRRPERQHGAADQVFRLHPLANEALKVAALVAVRALVARGVVQPGPRPSSAV